MHIVYNKDGSSNMCIVSSTKLQKTNFYDELYELIHRLGKNQLEEYVFLLDESYFEFASFHVTVSIDKPYSVVAFKKLVQQKIAELKRSKWISSPYVSHYIRNVQIDGVPSEFIIGKTGKIQFVLHFYFLKADAVTSFQVVTGSTPLYEHDYAIYPKSFFTLQYLHKKTHKKSFWLLYLWEQTCHLLKIEAGGYQQIEKIQLGLHLLKGSYEEQDVLKYYYQLDDETLQNSFLRKLVFEANEFYTSMLCKWLKQHITAGEDLLLISDVVANTFFIDALQQSYRETVNGYLLPIKGLEYAPSTVYQPSELDIASCYEYYQSHA